MKQIRKECKNMQIGTTETRNPNTVNIDLMSTEEIVRVINEEDHKVAEAIKEELPQIAKAVDMIVEKLREGGRLIYAGAGTSGRLGVLDAVECRPTYSAECVQGILAGGEKAMFYAQEGAEDSKELARKELDEIGFCQQDILCGIAASGRTPYVIGAMEYAHELGTQAIVVTNNKGAKVSEVADVTIAAVVGPEVVTGSTRMKAGSAQKMILNMLSTAAMIRLGKVYSNLMVDLKISNEKLVDRGERIVAMIAEVSQKEAAETLKTCQDVKVAIVMLKAGVDEDLARQLLAKNEGIIGKVFQGLGIEAVR
ncbi:MAG: N-acetylmuramic acid 6-phosphate etherase [Lachnospiraceae bacterium]|nr:N-acetylmuramic acid 6-phosphate etherase [Lachnospiraceae bacterium]